MFHGKTTHRGFSMGIYHGKSSMFDRETTGSFCEKKGPVIGDDHVATFVINVGPMSCRPKKTWLKHVETPSKSRYIKIYPPYILVSPLIKPMEHHIVGDFGRYHIFLSTFVYPREKSHDPHRTSPMYCSEKL